MVELRDILKSEELLAAIEAFANTARAHARHHKPARQPLFRNIAFGKKFQADKAVSIILERDPSYPGICDVLFLGFCGWAISPDEGFLRELYMKHGMHDYMAQAEREVGLLEQYDLKAEIAARYLFIGPDFLDDVYDSMGSYAAVSDLIGREHLEAFNKSEVRSIETVVKACEIFHFAADNFADKTRYKRISLTTVTEILEYKRYKKFVDKTTFWQQWAKCKSTVALIYAASSISIDGVSLLTSILLGQVSASTHMKVFDEWLGKARYFSEHVLSRLNVKGLLVENMKPLKLATKRTFESPIFNEVEIKSIRRNFLL